MNSSPNCSVVVLDWTPYYNQYPVPSPGTGLDTVPKLNFPHSRPGRMHYCIVCRVLQARPSISSESYKRDFICSENMVVTLVNQPNRQLPSLRLTFAAAYTLACATGGKCKIYSISFSQTTCYLVCRLHTERQSIVK